MAKLVIAVGAGMILMGLTIGAFPEQFLAMMAWDSRTGQSVAATIRLATGLIFILGAPGTRYPNGLRIFGGLIVLAGIAILLLPPQLWETLIGWAMYDNVTFMRLAGGLGGPLVGALIVYAAQPARSDD